MRKIKLSLLTLFSALVVALICSSCTSPVDYCDNVMTKCTKLEKGVNKFIDQLPSNDLSKIQTTYDENLAEINETIEYLQKLGPCNDKDYLQKAGLFYAQTYKEIYETEYAKAIESIKNNEKMDSKKITAILEKVEKKSLTAQSNLITNFTKFIKEFDITVNNNF